jgi:CheY-like chemotaxis protein
VDQYGPEVVVIDIGLPGMSGYDVARELRAHPKHRKLSLVAVTGYGQDNDRNLAYMNGFDMHMTKPVDPDELSRFVNNSSTGN